MTNRRTFLGAAVGAWTLSWFEAASAAGPTERQSELFAAWHVARRGEKPLLVVIIPDAEHFERGRWVGGALGEAPDPLMATLAGYAPAAATLADLRLLGAEVPNDAWFAIVDTTQVPAVVRTVAVAPADDPYLAVIEALERALGAANGAPDALAASAADGRKTWYTERIPGSHWARNGGCGLLVEGIERTWMGSCGIGSLPDRAARFLWFLDEQAG